MAKDDIDAELYKLKKEMERAWYVKRTQETRSLARRLLHHPLIFSYDRMAFNHVFPKQKMAAAAQRHLRKRVDRLLIAPCGRGDDLKYLGKLCAQASGIDLSPIPLKRCPEEMEVAVADIMTLPFPENLFDLVASPLFFHHFVAFGFVPFLREIYRVLKHGGGLVILEPSVWYPLNLITRPLKPIFGNPFDEVEDEGPLRPGLMVGSLKEVGFTKVEIQAATFSHPAFFVPLARIVNRMSAIILNVWPFKYIGWLVVYWCEKPECK